MVASAKKDAGEGSVKIDRRKLKGLVADHARSAEAINLRYVNDSEPGIQRIRKNGAFSFELGGKELTDDQTLNRIQGLVLPPAWKDVWICRHANGHLQATGVDTMGRKQYRYHREWSKLRSQTKFYHLYEFGKALPAI